MLTEKTFDANGVIINYVEGPPNGRPLILVHGGTVRWQTFSTVLTLLSLRYHTYAPDLRGHGASARTPGAYRNVDYASDVEQFLRRQVGEPAALLGWSMGSDIVLQTAAHLPYLTYALILEDPRAHLVREEGAARTPTLEAFLARFQHLYETVSRVSSEAELRAELAAQNPQEDGVTRRRRGKHLRQLDPEALKVFANDTLDAGYSPSDLLPKITCPVLLLYGESALGSSMEPHQVEWYQARLADLTYVQIPGAGHVLHRPNPILYLQHVMDFLESL